MNNKYVCSLELRFYVSDLTENVLASICNKMTTRLGQELDDAGGDGNHVTGIYNVEREEKDE